MRNETRQNRWLPTSSLRNSSNPHLRHVAARVAILQRAPRIAARSRSTLGRRGARRARSRAKLFLPARIFYAKSPRTRARKPARRRAGPRKRSEPPRPLTRLKPGLVSSQLASAFETLGCITSSKTNPPGPPNAIAAPARPSRPPPRRHNNKMAAYQTIETPLVADKPAGKSLKGLVAGAAAASFVLGALAATAVSATVAAPTTSFFRPLYVFDQQLGTTTFDECVEKCPTIDDFWHIPCITSFDMNHQLLAWMTKKYGPDKSFAWVGHRDSDWVEPECQAFQDAQFKGDMVKRNGCAFEGDLSKPECSGSDFDG
ncbi:unnamed protein product, partial [Pelagomonas calceolata]